MVISLLFIFALSACGESEKPKVVSSGDGNEQLDNDSKLEPMTAIGLPSLSAIGFVGINQIDRLFEVAYTGNLKSNYFAPCQKVTKKTSDDKKEDTFTVVHASCLGWSGEPDVFKVTFADGNRGMNQKLLKVTKNRRQIPLELNGAYDKYSQSIKFNEQITIERIADTNVFKFSYNTDNADSFDVVAENRIVKSRPDKKANPDKNDQEKVAEEERTKNINQAREALNKRGNIPSPAPNTAGNDKMTRWQKREAANASRNAPTTSHMFITIEGTINTSTDPWVWSFQKIDLRNIQSKQGSKLSDTTLNIRQKNEAEQFMLSDCSMPIGTFTVDQTISFNSTTIEKQFQLIPLNVKENNSIEVANYKRNFSLQKCEASGYQFANRVLSIANKNLWSTAIYLGANYRQKNEARSRVRSSRKINNTRSTDSKNKPANNRNAEEKKTDNQKK